MRKLMAILAGVVMLCTQLYAQNRTVTGKVTDDKGTPLVGVTVTTSSSDKRALTDNGGNFSIQVTSSDRSLRLTYVGFNAETITLGSASTYAVSMTSEDKSLSEVVVVGYGTQRKKDLTGSIASVKGEALANRPTQSFDQSLGGRAAGVQITIPSGVLNSPPVIRVRGTNSISLSSYPLVVIDGIPVYTGDFSSTNSAGNALASLNPNDIESVDVAKDAAATAIYGSRAANGVLFVTTKKGKAGRSKVNVDSWVGWSQAQRLPPLLDAFQYTAHKNEALTNAGLFSATNQFRLATGPNGQTINTRWYDYVYRDAVAWSNSVNVSGANEATSYYFSAGYTKQQGIIKRNDFNRLSALMNISHKVNKYFSLGGKIQYSKEDNLSAVSSGSLGDAFSTAGLGRVALVTAPNISPYNNDGSYSYSGALIGVGNNLQGQVGFNNPVIQLDQNRTDNYIDHIIGNGFAELKPFSWVTLRTQYGLDYVISDNDLYYSPISGEGFGSNGSVSAAVNKNTRTVWTNTIQFDKTFAEKHAVSLLGGIEEQRSKNNAYGLNRINVSDPAFINIQGGWATPNATGLGVGENYLYSQFGRLSYTYDNKYILNGSLRRDGASQLGVNSKYGTFWAASAAWEITREKFWSAMKLDRVFSSFRIRGSYGKVGNIGGLGNFASLSQFGSGLYGGSGTVSFGSAGNQDLTWETSKKTDVGINFGFMNDKITGEITYYNSNTDGLLLFVPAPPSAGLPSTIPKNVGTMYNRGFEFAINATPVSGKDFTWNTSFNLSYNKNMVTSLALGLDQIVSSTGGLENPSITKPGYPIGMIFVTLTKGVDPATGRRIFVNGAGRDVYFQHVAPSGQFRFAYADGTVAPTVSSADAIPYRNTNPKYFGGWDNTLRYKGFELNALFTYQFGSYIYYGTNAGLLDQRFWNNSTEVLTKWTKAGDVSNIPKVYFGDNVSNGSSFPLDMNVFSADFVKLRTITLGYNLPKNLVEKAKLTNVRFYVAGNNLLIITKYPGPDPEVSSNGNGSSNFGIDRNTVANQRTITVGLNIGL